ncbi:MAG: 3-isopropylmalate dehydratase small subunit [Deltaproteobacteria bacterium]|nr:3-isopropylmalate dehydratase small subunit [Deltaproteobacteria bacterium]
MSCFGGNVLFLDRSDINTDEIIPAKYLTEISKQALKPYLLEDLKLQGFDPTIDIKDKQVIITRANFGCGSSREHAPWALEINGIHVVIAQGFARIFRQNMFNCGMLAIALAGKDIDRLFAEFAPGPAAVDVDLDRNILSVSGNGQDIRIPFTISDFDRALVEAGGWLEYADKKY